MSNKFSTELADLIMQAARSQGDANIAQGDTGVLRQVVVETIDLSTAPVNSKLLNFPFSAVYVQDASDSSTEIQLKLYTDDSNNQPFTLRLKDVINFDFPISKGFATWEAQAGKSVTLMFLRSGSFRPGSFLISNTLGLDGTSISTLANVAVPNTATALWTLDLDAKVYTISNVGGDVIWIGSSSVAVGTGTPLLPGANTTIRNSAVFYGISPTASTLSINKEV